MPQSTTENQFINTLKGQYNSLWQVRDDLLHVLSDWQVLVGMDEDSVYPVAQACVAVAPSNLEVEVGV